MKISLTRMTFLYGLLCSLLSSLTWAESLQHCVDALSSEQYLDANLLSCSNELQTALDQKKTLDYAFLLTRLNEIAMDFNANKARQNNKKKKTDHIVSYELYYDNIDSNTDVRLLKKIRKKLRQYRSIGPHPDADRDQSIIHQDSDKKVLNNKVNLVVYEGRQKRAYREMETLLATMQEHSPTFDIRAYRASLEAMATIYQTEAKKLTALFLLRTSIHNLQNIITAETDNFYEVETNWSKVTTVAEMLALTNKIKSDIVEQSTENFYRLHRQATRVTEPLLNKKFTKLLNDTVTYTDPNLPYFSKVIETKMHKSQKKLQRHLAWWLKVLPQSDLLLGYQKKLDQFLEQKQSILQAGYQQQEQRIQAELAQAIPIESHLVQNKKMQKKVRVSLHKLLQQKKLVLKQRVTRAQLDQDSFIEKILTLPVQTSEWLLQVKKRNNGDQVPLYQQAYFATVVKASNQQCHAIYLTVQKDGQIIDGPKVTDFKQQYPLTCEYVF